MLLKNVSIINKFLLIVVLMLVASVANYYIVNNVIIASFQENSAVDTAYVDTSGRQRMLSQRIGFYAEQVVAGNQNAKTALEGMIKLHDESFYNMRDGGVAKGIANDFMLPGIPASLRPVFDNTEELWLKYKDAAYTVINQQTYMLGNVNADVKEAMIFLELNGPEMLKRNNNIVKAYSTYVVSSQKSLAAPLFLFVVINLAIILFLFYMADSISNSINNLRLAAEKAGKGEWDFEIKVESQDEIGKLAAAFQSMLAAVKFLMENADSGSKSKSKKK